MITEAVRDERRFGGPQVDLGLAGAGHAVEQELGGVGPGDRPRAATIGPSAAACSPVSAGGLANVERRRAGARAGERDRLACPDPHADEPAALEPAQQRRADCAGRQFGRRPAGRSARPLRSRQPLAVG